MLFYLFWYIQNFRSLRFCIELVSRLYCINLESQGLIFSVFLNVFFFDFLDVFLASFGWFLDVNLARFLQDDVNLAKSCKKILEDYA